MGLLFLQHAAGPVESTREKDPAVANRRLMVGAACKIGVPASVWPGTSSFRSPSRWSVRRSRHYPDYESAGKRFTCPWFEGPIRGEIQDPDRPDRTLSIYILTQNG